MVRSRWRTTGVGTTAAWLALAGHAACSSSAPAPAPPEPVVELRAASAAVSASAPASASVAAPAEEELPVHEDAPRWPPHDIVCGPSTCRYPGEICCLVRGADGVVTPHCPRIEDVGSLDNPLAATGYCSTETIVGNPTALQCDDSSDCGAGFCIYGSEPGSIAYSYCSDALGDRELCREGTCRTAATHCRKGSACPYFGTVCMEHHVCAPDALPRCGARRCTEAAPVCCVEQGAMSCAAQCGDPQRSWAWECTSAAGCGPAMSCCVQTTGPFQTSHCAATCDGASFAVACDSDADCLRHGRGSKRCGAEREPLFGLRLCLGD